MFLKELLCPECHCTVFLKDDRHKEVYCSRCGLVLVAPFSCGAFVPSGYLIMIDNKPCDEYVKHDNHVSRRRKPIDLLKILKGYRKSIKQKKYT